MSEPAKTTRREFLKGQPVTDALAKSREQEEAAEEIAAASNAAALPSYLMHVQRRAMACDFAVIFNAGQNDEAAVGC